MARRRGYLNNLDELFGTPQATPKLFARSLAAESIVINEMYSDEVGYRSQVFPEDDILVLYYQLRQSDSQLSINGKAPQWSSPPPNTLTLYDLREQHTTSGASGFHFLQFGLPRSALREMAETHGGRITDMPSVRPPDLLDDPVLTHLILSSRTALANPGRTSRLFIDQLGLAATAHFSRRYMGLEEVRLVAKGGLAPWQERRAKELLCTHLDGSIPVAEIARECGMSPSHFARAFRQTTGLPPHAWLMTRRIEIARALLRSPALALRDVARQAGFADQIHMQKIFKQRTGVTPGAFRRDQAH
ncbi:MAG: helix-turn-helix transcriptional regulator [Caulobacter sp.]|nr:helix-turn-helix transcriptional regulator [Caulobacter sp.]